MAVHLHQQLHRKKELLKSIEGALSDAKIKLVRGGLPDVHYPPEWEQSLRDWRDYCERALRQVQGDIDMLEGAVLG